MNDPRNPGSGHGDDNVKSLLGPVRELEPPLETRLANRAAITEELARLQTRQTQRGLPWWRRSIQVPVPLAIGLAASVVAAFAVTWNSQAGGAPDRLARPNNEPARQKINWAPTSSSIQLASVTTEPQYYERSVYLVGVGPIDMESGYEIQE